MLGIYDEEPELTDRILEDVLPSRPNERTGEWVKFRKLFARSDCALVIAPDPAADLLARLQALKDRHDGVPVVLVTEKDPEALRRLKDVVIEEVLWVEEVVEELPVALRRAEGERCFREIEKRLESAPGLSATLVAALTRAVRRRPPLTSVGTLASEVDRDRRTLWHHWRDAFDGDSGLTPKGFLDWVLLLRAAAAKSDDRSWREVAEQLGVHTRTIRRVADRRLEAPLSEVTNGSRDAFFDAFRSEVLDALVPEEREG